MTEVDERLIGRLEAHVDDLRADVKAMRAEIATLKSLVEQAKGARWALLVIASAFGGVSSLLGAWISGLFRGGM